jgi:hypothetical protein
MYFKSRRNEDESRRRKAPSTVVNTTLRSNPLTMDRSGKTRCVANPAGPVKTVGNVWSGGKTNEPPPPHPQPEIRRLRTYPNPQSIQECTVKVVAAAAFSAAPSVETQRLRQEICTKCVWLGTAEIDGAGGAAPDRRGRGVGVI